MTSVDDSVQQTQRLAPRLGVRVQVRLLAQRDNAVTLSLSGVVAVFVLLVSCAILFLRFLMGVVKELTWWQCGRRSGFFSLSATSLERLAETQGDRVKLHTYPRWRDRSCPSGSGPGGRGSRR